MRWWLAFVVVAFLLSGCASQQRRPVTTAPAPPPVEAEAIAAPAAVGPESLPLIPGTIAIAPGAPIGNAFIYLGKFGVSWTDGSCQDDGNHGGCLYWGGSGMTAIPGANQLNFGCFDWRDQVARISIPPLGGTAGIVQRCTSINNLSSIDPGDITNGYTIGGIYQAAASGPAVVSAWSYYDGDGSTIKSHWLTSNTFGNQQGPFQVGTFGAGRVGGQMTPIPQEWQALFGGDMLSGLCCISIIFRSSFGPSASVAKFADFGKGEPVPATPVLGYDEAHAMGSPGSGRSDLYNNTTFIRGIAWVPGTRTVMFVGLQGIGEICYGPSEGPTARCPSDPVNPTTQNSYHAPPYVHQAWLYDALDLLAVKQQKKHMGDVKPYALARLPQVPVTASLMRSATYDHTTKRLYLVAAYGDTPEVHVFSVAGGSTPPPTEICGNGIDDDMDGQIDEGCPVPCVVNPNAVFIRALTEWTPTVCPAVPNNRQTRQELWRREILTPAQNGGTCPSEQEREETRTGTQACTPATIPVNEFTLTGTVVRITESVNQGVRTYSIRVLTQIGEYEIGPWGGLQMPQMSAPVKVGDAIDQKWMKRTP